jgi:hypothetical protein
VAGQVCWYTGNVGIVFVRSATADCGGQSAVGDPPERALAGHCTPFASVRPHVDPLVSAGLSVYTPHGAVFAFGLQFDKVSVFPKTGAAMTCDPWGNRASDAAIAHARRLSRISYLLLKNLQ